jgi:hypothetical protein
LYSLGSQLQATECTLSHHPLQMLFYSAFNSFTVYNNFRRPELMWPPPPLKISAAIRSTVILGEFLIYIRLLSMLFKTWRTMGSPGWPEEGPISQTENIKTYCKYFLKPNWKQINTAWLPLELIQYVPNHTNLRAVMCELKWAYVDLYIHITLDVNKLKTKFTWIHKRKYRSIIEYIALTTILISSLI